ncbi:carbon monoxide dehydrogenase maturation protein [Amycolatopsis sp. NPDC021455]|uniref:MinD/ParA family ATP-binding protein n=1 Tax=Amycolatopsis sp. NPDC021455 TaxID=3154901 RepID=UPI0033E09D25
MLIALASLKGSPGVTTFTVALAANWPVAVRRLVVECDPAGGDLAQRFALAPSPGLLSLAAAVRQPFGPDVVWNHTQTLAGQLPVVAGPAGGPQARAALGAVTAAGSPLCRAAREPGVLVFADCGRLDPGSPAEPLMRQADVLLLVSGTYSDELAHVAARLHELGRAAGRASLVLAGRGHTPDEVERELGVPVMARIPHDPTAARSLTGHVVAGRGRKGGLAQAAVAVAKVLAGEALPVGAHQLGLGQQVPGVPAQQVRTSGVRVAAAPGLPNGHSYVSAPGKEPPL